MAILRSATRFDQDNWFQMEIDKEVPSCEVTGFLDGIPVNFFGDVEEGLIIAGTVEWNQILPTISAENWEGENASSISVNGTTIDVTFSSGNPNVYLPALRPKTEIPYIEGHKYLCSLSFKSTKEGSPYFRSEAFDRSFPIGSAVTPANTWRKYEAIANATRTVSTKGYFGQNNAVAIGLTYDDVVSYKDIQLFDLTQMFGSTIADYIYSLEQANAGAGVTLFRTLFAPDNYYNYNAGENMRITLRKTE